MNQIVEAASEPKDVEPRGTTKIDRDMYIKELQELRRDIATLHNHKEIVAYSALSFNVAAAGWAASAAASASSTLVDKSLLLALLLVAACLLHFMLRFQLIQRWHCTQFYQVYREAISELCRKEKEFHASIVNRSSVEIPPAHKRIMKYFIWTRDQAVIPTTYNYPTTDFLDGAIEKYHKIFVHIPLQEGGKGSSVVEKIPTLASIGCVLFIAFVNFNSHLKFEISLKWAENPPVRSEKL